MLVMGDDFAIAYVATAKVILYALTLIRSFAHMAGNEYLASACCPLASGRLPVRPWRRRSKKLGLRLLRDGGRIARDRLWGQEHRAGRRRTGSATIPGWKSPAPAR